MVSLRVTVACLERCDHPFQDFTIEMNSLKSQTKLYSHFLLTNVLFWTFSLVTGAVIVDVASFLDFCGEGTATMPAENQALESQVVFLLVCSTIAFVC